MKKSTSSGRYRPLCGFSYALSGAADLYLCDGSQQRVKAGDVFLFHPDRVRAIESDADTVWAECTLTIPLRLVEMYAIWVWWMKRN